jgi:hypothetical protein
MPRGILRSSGTYFMLIQMTMVGDKVHIVTKQFADLLIVKTFEDYDTFLPPKGVKPGHIFDKFQPADDIRKKLDEIKGHLVWMPLDYLKDANMAETGLQVNAWTESIYT